MTKTINTIIMTIEDDETTRATISLILEDAGYEVIEAANAIDAMRQLHAGDLPDLILTNWSMGGGELDGAAFLAAKRDDARIAAIPAVVCSGSAEPAAALSLGAKAVLSKPFAVDDLLNLVREQSKLAGEGSGQAHRKPH